MKYYLSVCQWAGLMSLESPQTECTSLFLSLSFTASLLAGKLSPNPELASQITTSSSSSSSAFLEFAAIRANRTGAEIPPQMETAAKVVGEAEELPKTIVRRVVKEKLSACSDDGGVVSLHRDALLAFSESARIFIHYLSATYASPSLPPSLSGSCSLGFRKC